MLMTSCGNARHTIQQSRPRNLARMLTTLRTNIKDPLRRKLFYARFGGKLIGGCECFVQTVELRILMAPAFAVSAVPTSPLSRRHSLDNCHKLLSRTTSARVFVGSENEIVLANEK